MAPPRGPLTRSMVALPVRGLPRGNARERFRNFRRFAVLLPSVMPLEPVSKLRGNLRSFGSRADTPGQQSEATGYRPVAPLFFNCSLTVKSLWGGPGARRVMCPACDANIPQQLGCALALTPCLPLSLKCEIIVSLIF